MAKNMSLSGTLKPRVRRSDIIGYNAKKKRIRKYTLEWTLSSSIALIHAVQKSENLWHPDNTLYKDRNMKNKSWEEISAKIGVPKQEAILRWSSLRGNYLAFLKKDSDSQNGLSTNKARRPNPVYYEMKFLNPVIKSDFKTPLESHSNKSPSPEIASSCESGSEQINDSLQRSPTPERPQSPEECKERLQSITVTDSPQRPPTPLRPRPMKRKARTGMRNMMTRAYDMLMESTQAIDEWGAFGNMITSNARAWSMENVGFARRYKAALSAVNAKFEMEAAELSIDEYIVN